MNNMPPQIINTRKPLIEHKPVVLQSKRTRSIKSLALTTARHFNCRHITGKTTCKGISYKLNHSNMSIKIKVIEKSKPGITGGGEKKFYASTVYDGEVTLEKLIKSITKICTVNGADVMAVLYALVEVTQDAIENGKIVRLGDLGSLRISISSNGEIKEEDVSASSVKNARTVFTPGKRLKSSLRTMEYTKVIK